ncbi:hypothetical protein QE152_g21723 [Popillia japonica]|uniref:HTH psq-type domain-containing protein n=1 Tax=Popillia japonica TaxID=7064 RepID=A0AAW1KNH8_POPJA
MEIEGAPSRFVPSSKIYAPLLQMPFKWKSKGRHPVSSPVLKRAVLEVISDDGKMRSTARKYDIDKMTLSRYVQKYKKDTRTTFWPKFNTCQIFTNEEENLLADYIIETANFNYSLTPQQTQKFVFQFATENNKKNPQNWILDRNLAQLKTS